MQDNTKKTSIICKVKKVVFYNPENGYSVLSAISDTEDAPFSICGILKGMPEGSVLHCLGCWKEHIMYGRQFIVDSWKKGNADEAKKLFCIPSRANSRPVYRTWEDFLKNNPDVVQKVKYVTEVFLTEVEKDYDDADYSYCSCDVPFTAQAKAIYYAVYNGQKISLITCTFTVNGFCSANMEDEDFYEIEEKEDCVDLPSIARKYSYFVDVEDVDGLSDLDFHTSGVPVSEEELRRKHYDDYLNVVDDSHEIADLMKMGDCSIGELKLDLEAALDEAFHDAGIDYYNGEYQCTRMFSKSKISGKFS